MSWNEHSKIFKGPLISRLKAPQGFQKVFVNTYTHNHLSLQLSFGKDTISLTILNVWSRFILIFNCNGDDDGNQELFFTIEPTGNFAGHKPEGSLYFKPGDLSQHLNRNWTRGVLIRSIYWLIIKVSGFITNTVTSELKAILIFKAKCPRGLSV